MCGGDRVNCNSQLRLTAKSLFACAHEKANNAHVMSKNSDLWARRSSFSHPTVVRVDDVASYVVYSWLFSPTLLNKTVTAVNALVARHFREAKIIPNYLGYLKNSRGLRWSYYTWPFRTSRAVCGRGPKRIPRIGNYSRPLRDARPGTPLPPLRVPWRSL